jgi:hypothetical protein
MGVRNHFTLFLHNPYGTLSLFKQFNLLYSRVGAGASMKITALEKCCYFAYSGLQLYSRF